MAAMFKLLFYSSTRKMVGERKFLSASQSKVVHLLDIVLRIEIFICVSELCFKMKLSDLLHL